MHGYDKSNRASVFDGKWPADNVQEAKEKRLQENSAKRVQTVIWSIPKNIGKVVVGERKKNLSGETENQCRTHEYTRKECEDLRKDDKVSVGRNNKFKPWWSSQPENKLNFNDYYSRKARKKKEFSDKGSGGEVVWGMEKESIESIKCRE